MVSAKEKFRFAMECDTLSGETVPVLMAQSLTESVVMKLGETLGCFDFHEGEKRNSDALEAVFYSASPSMTFLVLLPNLTTRFVTKLRF